MSTTFPPLVPSSRTLIPGRRDAESIVSGHAYVDMVQTSAALIGQSHRFTFTGLTADQLRQVRAHWIAVRGTSGRFPLGVTTWGGDARSVALVPTGYEWRYAGPPQDTVIGCGIYTLNVELILLPPLQIIPAADELALPAAAVVLVDAPLPMIGADLLIMPDPADIAVDAPLPTITTI